MQSTDEKPSRFEKARAAHGQERILVNCAGIATAIKTVGRDRETGAVKPYPIAEFEKVIAINLVGTFRCIAKSAKGMLDLEPIDGERGAIVNTASVAGLFGYGGVLYGSTKGAVVALTRTLAQSWARDGVRVNGVAPATVGAGAAGFPGAVGAGFTPFPKEALVPDPDGQHQPRRARKFAFRQRPIALVRHRRYRTDRRYGIVADAQVIFGRL